MPRIFATTSPEVSEREKRNMQLSRSIAAQGMVLLENDGTLPLTAGGKLALYGTGARHTIKGGTGSGDVNSRFFASAEEGLKDAGFVITTEKWLDRYDEKMNRARNDYYGAIRERLASGDPEGIMMLFNSPFKEPAPCPVEERDILESDTDTAVYIISRNSGEGRDRKPVPGDYELFEEEKEAIQKLAASYEKFVLVLNIGGVIDTRFIRSTPGINAVLLMSQAGNMGGYALADVLTGKVCPGGHLTTTWAENYLDYPGAADFGSLNGDDSDEYYKEGIFVGYRWFDTFGITPAYPFGYGKSYTEFSITTEKVSVSGEKVSVAARVKNIGKVSGRQVVQIYASAPEGTLEKPYQVLTAYGKTRDLNPGEEEVLTLTFPVASMTSYDPARAVTVLEPGTYYIRVGEHSRSTKVAAALTLDREVITEELTNILPLDVPMEEISSQGAHPFTYPGEEEEKQAAPVIPIIPEEIEKRKPVYHSENPRIPAHHTAAPTRLPDVTAGKATLEELVGELSVEEMADLCVGTSRGNFPGGESVIGAASTACPGAAGDTTSRMISDRDIRNMVLADGPAGLRLTPEFYTDGEGNILPGGGGAIPGLEEILGEQQKPVIPEGAVAHYQYCTAIPIATLLAMTWDPEAVRQAGDMVGGEMVEMGCTVWLAPGMNIHRNPLCGRNFEYYSEDPLVAGICAAADTIGVQSHPGVGTCIKHLAFNNQEDNRFHTSAHVGERAAREIYLKGFEIAVKAAQPMCIMTSYNLVNGIHTANNRDLVTTAVRDEWGFAGLVMTDWGTTGSVEMEPGRTFKYGSSNAAACILAGNDLIMPGSQEDVDEIIRSVGAAPDQVSFPLKTGDLQACARRILNVTARSSCYEKARPYNGGRLGLSAYIETQRS